MTMIYAVIDERGDPMQIRPGEFFATTQLKVAEDEALHYKAPAGTVISHALLHSANAMECWEPADFDRYQVYQVEEPALVEGQALVRYTLSFDGHAVAATAVCEPPTPPAEVHAAAFKIALDAKASMRAGKTALDDVEDAIAAKGSRAHRIYFDGMPLFGRASEMLTEIMTFAGYDQAGTDALLIAAAKLI